MDGAIRVKELTKIFRSFKRREGLKGAVLDLFKRDYTLLRAVDSISLEIEPGEVVGYIGANGAGKSTTIKMLTGILHPTSGTVEVSGMVPHNNRIAYTRRIGVVFGQRTQLWWDIAVIEAFRLLSRVYRVERTDFDQRLKQFVEVLGIGELLHRPVRKLSLGERMRCDLAASLLHNPPVVFLDEPTIGLDVAVKSRIRDFILEINANHNTTVILTTHDMKDIERICERVVIIDKGHILFDGSLSEIHQRFHRGRLLNLSLGDSPGEAAIDELSAIAGLKVLSNNDTALTVAFNPDKHSASSLIDHVLKKFEVRDLTLQEPELADIVRDIYEGSDGGDV